MNVTWAALLIVLALNSGTSFAYVWLLEASFGATLDKAIGSESLALTGATHLLLRRFEIFSGVSTGWAFTWSAYW